MMRLMARHRRGLVPEWRDMSDEQKWRWMLFPMQKEMSESQDKDELNRLMDIRKEVLFSLLAFVADTKRFIEKKDTSSFFVL